MAIQKAPRTLRGTATAFDRVLTVDAQISREVLDGPNGTFLPGEYSILGKIREQLPRKIFRYVGIGDMIVDFGEQGKFKCRLKTAEGDIESIGSELGGMDAEELWVRSGGGAL